MKVGQRLAMNCKWLLISTLLFCVSCSTAPDFNRNNTNDPESEYFIPDSPDNSPVSIAIDNNRNVILNWDQKELQFGVIISKKYRENSPYLALDTLYNNITTYTDSSGHFIPGTTYKADFFRLMEDSTMVVNKIPAEITMKFQAFRSMNISYSDELEISYNYPSSSEPGTFRYFDGVEILINKSGNVESPKWDTVGVVNRNEFENERVKTNLFFELFELYIKTNQFVTDSSGSRIILSSTTERFYINFIEDVRFEFNDELSGTVRWSNGAEFYAGYIIESSQKDTVYGEYKSSHQLNFKEAPSLPLTVSVTPFVGNNKGESRTSSNAYLDVSQPLLFFTPIDDQSFELSWEVRQNNKAAGYIIEQKKVDETEFLPVDTVSADQNSYIVSGLRKEDTYNFAVHSYTSEWSPSFTVGFIKTMVITHSDSLEKPSGKIAFSKNKKIIAKFWPDNSTLNQNKYIIVKDLETNSEYQKLIPNRIIDHVISEQNNTITFVWDRSDTDKVGDYISVYDFVTGEYLRENYTAPSTGTDELELMADDQTVVIDLIEGGFQTFDTVTGQFGTATSDQPEIDLILRPFMDSAINCSDSGIFEYDLNTGDIINQLSEPCVRGNLSVSSNIFTFHDDAEVKVADLNTFSLIKTINVPRFGNFELLLDFWYFKEDDLLVYLPLFHTYDSIYYGYKVAENNSFSFTIPSYTEDHLNGRILHMERNPNGTYSVITFDGEFTLSLKEAWSKLEVEQ